MQKSNEKEHEEADEKMRFWEQAIEDCSERKDGEKNVGPKGQSKCLQTKLVMTKKRGIHLKDRGVKMEERT